MEQIIKNDAEIRLFSIPEARERLGGVSNDTIYKHINSRALKTVMQGTRRFVSNRAINEFITERER